MRFLTNNTNHLNPTTMLQVIEYSERCVAVLGTSKDNMEQRAAMKSMKGKWNPSLKNVGGGWVFSKRKNGEEVAKWVAQYNATHTDAPTPSAPQTPAPKKQPQTPKPQPTAQPTPQPSPDPAHAQPQSAPTITIQAAPPIELVEDELEGAPF